MRTAKKMFRVVGAIALLAALTAGSAAASSFSLYGTYWDTDDAGEAVGAGLAFEFPITAMVGVELRGAYYQQGELENPFSDSVDGLDDIFRESDLNLAPIEAGLRFKFNQAGAFRPYVAGGVSYIILDLDSDFLEIDDETGWYGLAGAQIGNGVGIDFLVEVAYRKVEATVGSSGLTPIDELELEGDVHLDVDGPSINLGAVWTF